MIGADHHIRRILLPAFDHFLIKLVTVLKELVSIDFSGGIDADNPVAFAMLADGTPISAIVDSNIDETASIIEKSYSNEDSVSHNTVIGYTDEKSADIDSQFASGSMIGNPLYPRTGCRRGCRPRRYPRARGWWT